LADNIKTQLLGLGLTGPEERRLAERVRLGEEAEETRRVRQEQSAQQLEKNRVEDERRRTLKIRKMEAEVLGRKKITVLCKLFLEVIGETKLQSIKRSQLEGFLRLLEAINDKSSTQIRIDVHRGVPSLLAAVNLANKNDVERRAGPGIRTNSIQDCIDKTPLCIPKNPQINPLILVHESERSRKFNLYSGSREQAFKVSGNVTEIVMGIDFGTSNTKVVIQEQGSERAWAIPFDTGSKEQFLLPSKLYFSNNEYSLFGEEADRLGNLKLPIILGNCDLDSRCRIVAFLTLVVKHAREWFLVYAAGEFPNFTFEWFFNIGMPSANAEDKQIVETYEGLLRAAVTLSRVAATVPNHDEIIDTLNSTGKSPPDSDLAYATSGISEIQAQLEGHVRSDRWSSKKIKFLLIDIGGGTVDVAVVNVTSNNNGTETYNNLKSKVAPLGIKILHADRLAWLIKNIERCHDLKPGFKESIVSCYRCADGLSLIPKKVSDYLTNIELPDGDIDSVFYEEFRQLVFTDILSHVRLYIDVELSQWKHIQVVFCGGGSLHTFYNKMLGFSNTNFSKIELLKPSNLSADGLDDEEYHRISVAYGLSFGDHGQYVSSKEILPMRPETAPDSEAWRANYIDQP
jgi:hypothetical protein